jgi:hypothetical protein
MQILVLDFFSFNSWRFVSLANLIRAMNSSRRLLVIMPGSLCASGYAKYAMLGLS